MPQAALPSSPSLLLKDRPLFSLVTRAFLLQGGEYRLRPEDIVVQNMKIDFTKGAQNPMTFGEAEGGGGQCLLGHEERERGGGAVAAAKKGARAGASCPLLTTANNRLPPLAFSEILQHARGPGLPY